MNRIQNQNRPPLSIFLKISYLNTLKQNQSKFIHLMSLLKVNHASPADSELMSEGLPRP
jgi:hypothetical protein